jgi:hypothetical protein
MPLYSGCEVPEKNPNGKVKGIRYKVEGERGR